MSKQHVYDKGEDTDDDRQSGPDVHTHGIQVLEVLEVCQLLFPTPGHLLGEMRLPVVELNDTDAKEDLCH